MSKSKNTITDSDMTTGTDESADSPGRTKRIMISAGEASGDLHAANLVKALRAITPAIEVTGMGGDKLREAGAVLQVDCAEMAVVGIVVVIGGHLMPDIDETALTKVAQIIMAYLVGQGLADFKKEAE